VFFLNDASSFVEEEHGTLVEPFLAFGEIMTCFAQPNAAGSRIYD